MLCYTCVYERILQGLRAQIDRDLYRQYMQEEVYNTNNLTIMESSVDDLVIGSHGADHTVQGVCLGRCATLSLDSWESLDWYTLALPLNAFGCTLMGWSSVPD